MSIAASELDEKADTRGAPASPPRRRRRRALVWSIVAVLTLTGLLTARELTRPRAACAQEETSPDAAFAVIGDFGGGEAQADVASAIESWQSAGRRVDAVLTTGDNVNQCGRPEDFEAHLVTPYRDLDVPMWATLGNRDVLTGHGDAQLEFLGLPDLPYVKELPGIQLLFLDSNRVDAEQAAWLDATLSAPGPALRVVLFHHPAYSCGFNGATPAVIESWVPVLEKHRVAAVLNGHDHYYERFVSPAGVNYIVTGGGGMYLLPIEDDCTPGADRVEAESTHHFVYGEVRGTTLTLTAVDADGQVIDEIEVAR